jgi:hypothetical protein
MATTSKGNGFIFRVKTEDGLSLRVLSEYFANLLTFPPFHINEKGIFVRAMNKAGDVLVDVQMPRTSFPLFKCSKPIYFGINATHFYRLLRPIKKKDTVFLFIREKLPMQLGICVEQGDKPGDRVTTYIQINYIQPDEIELPEGYNDNPIVETSKRFQRLKMLHTIGPKIWATVIGGKKIRFTVNGKNLFSREVTIGEMSDDDNDDDENTPSYTHTYSTNHITQLTKCAGQRGNIQICQNEELPLFIWMQLESLATLSVYIKSQELIDQESSADNPNKENQDSEDGKSEKIEIRTNVPETKSSPTKTSSSKNEENGNDEEENRTETNEEDDENDEENEEEQEDNEEDNEEDEDDE